MGPTQARSDRSPAAHFVHRYLLEFNGEKGKWLRPGPIDHQRQKSGTKFRNAPKSGAAVRLRAVSTPRGKLSAPISISLFRGIHSKFSHVQILLRTDLQNGSPQEHCSAPNDGQTTPRSTVRPGWERTKCPRQQKQPRSMGRG